MNGEMPPAFNPKIWWLEVGLNDLGRSQCSEEVVVLGVLRVVEEILDKKDGAIVVINSLFPLADLRGGLKPGENDFKDSFNKDLRQRPTKQMNKPARKRDRDGTAGVDAGATDHGDSTVIKGGHLKQGDREGGGKRGKNQGGKRKPEKAGNGRTRLLEDAARSGARGNRQTRFSWGKKQDNKPVKMNANKEKQKKFNPVTHKERKLPLWTSVSAINAQLKKFASKHNDKVYFFDVTDIFTEREENDIYILKTDMISIRGHPTRKGFEAWEEAVKVKAKSLLGGADF